VSVSSVVYLDSSAIVKLIFDEPETDALQRFLADRPSRFSSVVARAEVIRAARSVGDDLVVGRAHDVLDGLDFIELDSQTIRRAAGVEPRSVRTLEAIHLAAALSLEPDLAGIVVYDRRLAAAARAAGLTVWAPA
jgi:uncharacterized protein